MKYSRENFRRYGYIFLALVLGLAGVMYFLTSASTAFPGVAAARQCEALGLTPAFGMQPLSWIALTRLLWYGAGDSFFSVLNGITIILALLSLAVLAYLAWDVIRSVATLHFEDEDADSAGLGAALITLVLFASSPSLWGAANRGTHAVLSLTIVVLLLLGFRLLLKGGPGVTPALCYWAAYGFLCMEAPFSILLLPILGTYFIARIAGRGMPLKVLYVSVAAGVLGLLGMGMLKSLFFLPTEGAELQGITTLLSAGWHCAKSLHRDLAGFFPRVGWLLQISIYWVPLIALLSHLRQDAAFNFEEKGQVFMHAVATVLLSLTVVFSVHPPAYALARPETIIFGRLIHAIILGYLSAYWLLFLRRIASAEDRPAWLAACIKFGSVFPAMLILVLAALSCRGILKYVDMRSADVLDAYVSDFVEELGARDQVLTDGTLDPLFLLKASRSGRSLELYNIALQENALYLKYVMVRCKDPERKADAAIGLIPLFRSYIRDSQVRSRVAVVVAPDEITAGTQFSLLPGKSMFVPPPPEQQTSSPAAATDREFFLSTTHEDLRALSTSETPLAILACWMLQQSSLIANNIGVSYAEGADYVGAQSFFETSQSLWPSNVSAVLNTEALLLSQAISLPDESRESHQAAYYAMLEAVSEQEFPFGKLLAHNGQVICTRPWEEASEFTVPADVRRYPGAVDGGLCLLPECAYHRGRLGKDVEDPGLALLGEAYEACMRGDTESLERLAKNAQKEAGGAVQLELNLLLAAVRGDSDAFFESIAREVAEGALDYGMLSRLAMAALNKRDADGRDLVDRLLDLLSREKSAEVLVAFLKGKLQALDQQWGEAERHFRFALARVPENRAFVEGLLEVYLSQAKGEDARKLARRILVGDPEHSLANVAMGIYYMEDDQPDLAETFFRRALAASKDSVLILNNLAWLLRKSSRIAEAEKMVERALELTPDNVDVMDTHGMVLLEKGDIDTATAVLKRAYEKEGERADIAAHYALVLLKGGNASRAGEVLKNIEGSAEAKLAKEDREIIAEVRRVLKQ